MVALLVTLPQLVAKDHSLVAKDHSNSFYRVQDLIYLSNRVIALLNDAIKGSIQHGDQVILVKLGFFFRLFVVTLLSATPKRFKQNVSRWKWLRCFC